MNSWVKEQLSKFEPYIFFPLHFEPEVSIQVFGKSFQNQIEVVRTIALSAPAGTRILVKEHPRSLGFRKLSYYEKLLKIPNVRLVDPFLNSLPIVKSAKMVVVISGSIGLEAAICEIPVMVLGKVPYQILPDTMVRACSNYAKLEHEIKELFDGYRFDEEPLIRYFAAVVSTSVPANLYTELLEKSNRHVGEDFPQNDIHKQYEILAEYILSEITAQNLKTGLSTGPQT